DMATNIFEQVGNTAQKAMEQAEKSVNEVDEALQNVSPLNVDTSDAERSLENAENSVNEVDEAVEGVSDLDIDTSDAEQSLENAENSVNEVDNAVNSVSDLDISTDAAEKSLNDTIDTTNELDTSIQNVSDLNISTEEVLQQLANVGVEIEELDDAIKNVSELDINTDNAISAIQEVENAADSVNDAVQSVDDLNIETGDSAEQLHNVANAVEEVKGNIDDAEESAVSFGERMSEALSNLEERWLEITAVAGSFGLALESAGSKQRQFTEQIDRISAATGIANDTIREAAVEISNVTFPLEDALNMMETGRQQGLKSIDALKEYASFWDMVGDATGLAGPQLAEASSALRTVGIAAGQEKEALAAFGYITENTTGNVQEFLRFLERTGPQLSEMGMDINDAAAMLGILEHEFGMSGRMA